MPPKKTDLSKLSDVELEKELSRRRQERIDKRAAQRRKANAAVVSHAAALLDILTEHGKTSCDDKDPRNATNGCDRCFLLVLMRSNYMDNDYKLLLSFVKDPIDAK